MRNKFDFVLYDPTMTLYITLALQFQWLPISYARYYEWLY